MSISTIAYKLIHFSSINTCGIFICAAHKVVDIRVPDRKDLITASLS